MQGSFLLADNDVSFNSVTNPDAVINKGTYIYTDNSLYIVSTAGSFNGAEAPTHKSGYEKCGNAELAYICELAKTKTISKN